MNKTLVDQVIPLQPMEKHTRQDIHMAVCGGPQAGAGGCVVREAAAHGQPTQEKQELWPNRTHTEAAFP